jgi:hypothetical protein
MTETGSEPLVHSLLSEPSVPPLVGTIWALLVINTLGFNVGAMVIPFPHAVGQIVTMGALVCALALAVVVNPRLHVLPNPYLLLLSLLLIVSIASSLRMESGTGALFRCFRGTVFLATLWLLTRWWRGDLTFVRHHVRALGAVLLSVLLGLVIAPGKALSPPDGRLIGTLWPMLAPGVGQFAAVVAGLTIVLWVNRMTDGRTAAWVAPPAIGILLLSHTRTAVLGLVAALVGGCLTVVFTSRRTRRTLAIAAALAGLGTVGFGSAVTGWLARGQDTETLTSLTGRQTFWDALLAQKRTLSEQFLGVGLSNKSFNGLPIDSSWLAIYWEQGLVGVALVAILLVVLLAAAALRPPSPARTCAVFLILYVAVSSYTEVGLGDVSPYFLHLAVAVSLLAPGVGTAAVTITPVVSK